MRNKLSENALQRLRIWLLLTPAMTVIVMLFVGGLIAGLARSLNYFPLIGLTEPNLDAYRAVLGDETFLRSLAVTSYISFTATAISSVLAVAAALLLRPLVLRQRLFYFMFSLNLTVPHAVGAIGISYLLSQGGLASRLARSAGLTDRPADFPALVADPWAIGIIVEYVWKETPFIGIVVLAILASVGEDYESAARSLGAGRWQTFRYVTMPLVLPGLVPASVIVFAFTFGAFEVPFLLGRTAPTTLPVLAYRSYTDVDLAARPEAMAISMVIAGTSALIISAYLALTRHYSRG